MQLKKIQSKDLISIDDNRITTCLKLDDYDWMQYSLAAYLKTKEMGELNIIFEYFGTINSQMKVKQVLNDTIQEFTYEYSTDIFYKNLIKFLNKHIEHWKTEYAFDGEEEVITFFNDVIEKGNIIKQIQL